jgi:3-oxoacyl-ACP reductase-like protein
MPTRGSGLMDATKGMVAHDLESYGVRTFLAKEMTFNILGLYVIRWQPYKYFYAISPV